MPRIPKSAQKNVVQKCPACGKKFKNKVSLIGHVERCHADQIPEGWSASRYENYLRTGKSHGKCVVCGKDTDWNEATWKYGRLCNNPECKKSIAKQADERNMKIYGKAKLIDDPEMQRKMIYSKRTSGTYYWEDDPAHKYENLYDSNTSRKFLEMLDVFLNFSPSDVFSPSPNTYPYKYEGKTHQYIPDHYIASLNLEVEIKEPLNNQNMHPKIQAVDKVKEKLKDEAMENRTSVNYIKINGEDYREFFAYLNYLKGLNDNTKVSTQTQLGDVGESFELFKMEKLNQAITEATSIDQLNKLTYKLKNSLIYTDPNYDFDKCVSTMCDRMDKCETIADYEDLYENTLGLRKALKNIMEDDNSSVEKKRLAEDTYRYINDTYLIELENRIKVARYKNPLKLSAKEKQLVWFNRDFEYCNQIAKTLNAQELKYMCGGNYDDSKYLIYREVAMYKSEPVAFIEVEELPWKKGKAMISIATAHGERYRRKGFAEYLCERYILSDIPDHIKKLVWEYDPANTASIRLAKKLGFRRDPNKPTSHHFLYLKVHRASKKKFWSTRESTTTSDDMSHQIDSRVDKLNDVIAQIDNMDGIEEASSIQATKKDTLYRPVFVFLSFTNTPFGKLIHSYTGQDYTHASLSLDTSLHHMVSFGQGYDGRFGFVPDESITMGGYKMSGDRGRYALYMYLASENEYNTIKSIIQQFTDKIDDLKYSFKGCVNIALHKETHDENKYFCSQFVASVLQTVNPKLFNRDSSLYTPGDLQFKSQRNYVKISDGKITEYDEKKTDGIVKKILSRKGFKDVQVNYNE